MYSNTNVDLTAAAVALRTPAGPFGRILVAVDDSKQAQWAVQIAGQLAESLGAKVALVHAYFLRPGYSPELAPPIEDVLAEMKESGVKLLAEHRTALPKSVAVEQILVEGEACEQIVHAAVDWKADLIVTGTHGRGRLAQFLVGSTAEGVIRMARCPVLAVAHEPVRRVESLSTEPAKVVGTA
jgi:nucleotide-binding universal stress UspA family protein